MEEVLWVSALWALGVHGWECICVYLPLRLGGALSFSEELSLYDVSMCVFVCASQNASYLNREDPDLPVCFEQTVLVWIPLGFLWLCAPRHLVSLCRRTQVGTKHLSKHYICKQVMHPARVNINIKVIVCVIMWCWEGRRWSCFITQQQVPHDYIGPKEQQYNYFLPQLDTLDFFI